MSKFGDLIDVEVPVLFEFFTEWSDESETMHDVLRDVAAAMGDKARVIKIICANVRFKKRVKTKHIYRHFCHS